MITKEIIKQQIDEIEKQMADHAEKAINYPILIETLKLALKTVDND